MEAGMIWIIAISMIVGVLSVIIAIASVRLWDRHREKRSNGPKFRQEDIVFLFENKSLINATPSAHQLLAGVCTPQDEWHRLISWIGPHFPGATEQIERLGDSKRINLTGKSPLGREKFHLSVENLGKELVRITLSTTEDTGSLSLTDGTSRRVMEEELQLLRQAAERTPALVWREDPAGQIVWANTTYLKYVGLTHEGAIDWPLPRLLSPLKPSPEIENCRDKFTVLGKVIWFDCYEHDIGDQKIFYALPADAAVRAERNLRDFVQTLTKTFASLQVGLAIFDHQRNLQLFNPALLELMQLPVEFLVSRPTLADFLDQLRERRMVPEPKDFRSWQKQIINLENSAASGHHLEEWSLPGGQTYRVTGCPHSDGAIAFLFEDITSDTVKNRELREALTLNQQILDELNEAVIVLGQYDQPILINQAYLKLWGEAGDNQADVIAKWAKAATSGAELARLTDSSRSVAAGARENGTLSLKDGRLLDWSVFQISGGQRVVSFDPAAQSARKQKAPADGKSEISDEIYES